MGLFKVTIGVMGSSKSSRAITEIKNSRFQSLRVFVIKPSTDDRDGNKISSRIINETIQADIVITLDGKLDVEQIISQNYDLIVVDEMHMLSISQINDLYKISAMSDTHVYLYGLSLSWKGTPFQATSQALALADEIEKIKTMDKNHNLLTHHIKKQDGIPCDITKDDDAIDTGDLGEDKYYTVSKEDYYKIYSMLGQI